MTKHLIVDANLCTTVFKKPNLSYKPLHDALMSSKLTIVFGGQLTKEYEVAGVFDVVFLLNQSGRALRVADGKIIAEQNAVAANCTSNDAHIIALARVEPKARVLVSDDQKLRNDFKAKALVDNPRGKIYSPTRHVQSVKGCS